MLSDSCLRKDGLVLNYIRACAVRAEFQIDLVIGPPTLDSIRTEYSRKADFLSRLDGMLNLLLLVAKLELYLEQAGRFGSVDREELETHLYENKRTIAVLAQARELYEQGPRVYLRAQRHGGLITDGRR